MGDTVIASMEMRWGGGIGSEGEVRAGGEGEGVPDVTDERRGGRVTGADDFHDVEADEGRAAGELAEVEGCGAGKGAAFVGINGGEGASEGFVATGLDFDEDERGRAVAARGAGYEVDFAVGAKADVAFEDAVAVAFEVGGGNAFAPGAGEGGFGGRFLGFFLPARE